MGTEAGAGMMGMGVKACCPSLQADCRLKSANIYKISWGRTQGLQCEWVPVALLESTELTQLI